MSISLTNDQYEGLAKLEKWYRKYTRQFIDISGVTGTGAWDLIQTFLDRAGIETREVMYLSFDQKQVLELAAKRYHAYYINAIIYKYTRYTDFDTLPVVNPHSDGIIKYQWKKDVRNKIDPIYRIMIVFDSVLMNDKMLSDLGSFGLPVILVRDPVRFPAPDTYTFMRDPNIVLREVHPMYARNPITHFAHLILNEEKLQFGNYDNVSVVPKKQMNLYNLRSADMVLTTSDKIRNNINQVYREKILHQKTSKNIIGEKVIVMNDMYGYKLTNKDEKKIKIYLMRGLIGYLSKCNSHAVNTKYVPVDIRPEFYHDSFEELVMDRHYLNGINVPTRQIIPDETIQLQYAYALTVHLARLSHWDKVTLIVDTDDIEDNDVQIRSLYSAIVSAKRSLTIII